MNTFQDDRGTITQMIDDQGIAHITFEHPSHNAFPSTQLNHLAAILNEASLHPDIRVILLKSAGEKTFCAGASFDELLTLDNEVAGKAFFSGFAHVLNAIRKCRKMVVCQVQGKAVGGGVGLAAACDYVFATTQAHIKLSELSINIGPFVIEPAVKRKIGLAALTELTLNPNDFKDPFWAKEKGLFQEVHPDIETLSAACYSFCQRLAGYNPESLMAIKAVLWENTEGWEELLYARAAISGKLVLSPETKAFLKRFKK